VLGSVAERVVREAPCAVLVVRRPDDRGWRGREPAAPGGGVGRVGAPSGYPNAIGVTEPSSGRAPPHRRGGGWYAPAVARPGSCTEPAAEGAARV